MPKVAVIILLVVLIVLLGTPLPMPMSGASMCPDCNALDAWSMLCVAILASIALLAQRRATRLLVERTRRPILVSVDVLEPPPRLSS